MRHEIPTLMSVIHSTDLSAIAGNLTPTSVTQIWENYRLTVISRPPARCCRPQSLPEQPRLRPRGCSLSFPGLSCSGDRKIAQEKAPEQEAAMRILARTPAAHCPCAPTRRSRAADRLAATFVGCHAGICQRARRGYALLRAEPLTRTDSLITSMAKSQHISGVKCEPGERAGWPWARSGAGIQG
jgi:hypothetical protein